jgi:predicted PurR-regulated permease PerM
MDKTVKNVLLIMLFILAFYLMATLSKIIIPLVLALLCATLFQPLIMFLKKYKIPNFLVYPLITIFTLGALFLIGEVISSSVLDIIAEKDFLTERFMKKFASILAWYNDISGSRFRTRTFFDQVYKQIDKDWLAGAAKSVAGGITSFSGDFIMFSLYYVILLAGIPKSREYVAFVGAERKESFLRNFENVQKSVISYMMLKTLMNLILGVCVFVICVIFDVKFPLFWGFLMFIFHYIPTVGAFVGTLPPLLMYALQIDNWSPLAFLAIALVGAQFLAGNILEPKVMGNKLKLNTLTVIFGLVFWGNIWGIAGMILSVPLLVVMRLILEKIPDLSILARVMGSPGEIKDESIETK